MPRSGPRKYDPLAVYLAGLSEDRVTLTLAEIEQILGQALPRTAGTRHWWVNTAQMRQAQARLSAGWIVRECALRTASRTVTFARQPAETTHQPFGSH